MGYVPGRGDVVWIDMNPRSGQEQAGRRPAIVLPPESYNRRVGLAVFCPVASRVKGYPFEVPIPEGLPVEGVVLSDQIKSLDWRARNVGSICTLPEAVASEVLRKAGLLLR